MATGSEKQAIAQESTSGLTHLHLALAAWDTSHGDVLPLGRHGGQDGIDDELQPRDRERRLGF